METRTVTKSQLRAILAFTSSDATRYNLGGVYFEKSGRMVATDGRRLAVLDDGAPIAEGSGDGGVILEGGPLRSAMKAMGAKDTATIVFDTELGDGIATIEAGGATFKLPAIAGEFPNWRQVLPNGCDASDEPVGLAPQLLAVAATAAKWLGIKALKVSFNGPLAPATFEGELPDGGGRLLAVIMPIRLE